MFSFLFFMKAFLHHFFFLGKIPFFSSLKKGALLLSFFVLFLGFLEPKEFKEFGEIGFTLLISLLALRPLSQIFPDIRLLRTLLPARREFGILCASLLFAHVSGFFISKDKNVFETISSSSFWSFDSFLMWGFLGFICATFLALTSNPFAVRLLKKYWKPFQRISYIFLLFALLHTFFQDPTLENAGESLLPILFLGTLWILSFRKITFRIPHFFASDHEQK